METYRGRIRFQDSIKAVVVLLIRRIFSSVGRVFAWFFTPGYVWLKIVILFNVFMFLAFGLVGWRGIVGHWFQDKPPTFAGIDPTNCSLDSRSIYQGSVPSEGIADLLASIISRVLALLGETPDSDLKSKVTRVHLASGVVDGYYFTVGRNFSKKLNHRSEQGDQGLQILDYSTRGSLDNINCAVSGQVQLFISQSDTVERFAPQIDRGECSIDDKSPLLRLYREAVTVVARVDAGAKSIRDLENMEICLPLQGSGSYINATELLKAHGVLWHDTEPEGMHYSDCMEALEDGKFDAMIYTIKHPHEYLLRFSEVTSKPVEFVPVTELTESKPNGLKVCSDAINVGDYPRIAYWMERDTWSKEDRENGTDVEPSDQYHGALTPKIQTFCTTAALYHSSCIDTEALHTIECQIRSAGYGQLVPVHLQEAMGSTQAPADPVQCKTGADGNSDTPTEIASAKIDG